jgi:glycosyltransferase involved in cell wall biosynthesis
MKICLVTAFPPSKRGLNEYGYHLACELQSDPLLSLTILADKLETPQPELPGFDVVRCWSYDNIGNPAALIRAIREIRPDVAWYNLLFSTFGSNPVAAFAGLASPALSRAGGTYTHVTLHHLMDNIELSDANIRFRALYKAGGYAATRMLLLANSVSVLLPAYRRTLIEKYRGRNVHWRAHGILGTRPEPADFTLRGNPDRLLAFGKWGTYKRLDLLIESFDAVRARNANVQLIVAGGSHPLAPGYVESVASRYRDRSDIVFTGYVEESDIGDLFRSATLLVMPYSSATGSSGVAHLACEFALPIVCADIADFREMAADERIEMSFYRAGDARALAAALERVLGDRGLQRDMADRNYSAALRMTMPQIINQYMRSFDLQKRRRALRPLSRFRRIPPWVPSRSAIFQAALPRWTAWN